VKSLYFESHLFEEMLMHDLSNQEMFAKYPLSWGQPSKQPGLSNAKAEIQGQEAQRFVSI